MITIFIKKKVSFCIKIINFIVYRFVSYIVAHIVDSKTTELTPSNFQHNLSVGEEFSIAVGIQLMEIEPTAVV